MKQFVAQQSTDSGRVVSPRRVARDGDQLRSLASKIGNRATGRLLQRYMVDPMPIIYRQFLMWRPEAKVLDLNCGWYSQLAAVDHFYQRDIRAHLTRAQRQQLEGASTPHLSYESGRALLPYSNTTVFTDFGFDPSGEETAAIATSVDVPRDDDVAARRAQWKALLRAHGPLVVGGPFGEPFGVPHYVTVVGVEGGRMHYLDALTFTIFGDQGTRRSQPLEKMSASVTSIDRVDPAAVNQRFAPLLAQARQAATTASSAAATTAPKT